MRAARGRPHRYEKGAVKKRAIKKTATTLKRVGKQSFLWYNKFDEKIPTRI